MMVSH